MQNPVITLGGDRVNGALINNRTLCDSTQSAQNLEWDNRFLILCNISPSSVMPRIYNECLLSGVSSTTRIVGFLIK
jgi:hypothetical protein